ncbi:caspase, EACC1-associated type [Streptomyces sp. NPDC055243]|uniref:caspase, EACC1-associated type n=1 Tax=Streptomyces sp. NPDC055243 TaxID=3365720 RepID=UPI0037D86804
MALLSDPARSEAVLVGVHDYTHLAGLPAVARNLKGLQAVLTDPAIWGLPEGACTVISQPGSAGRVLDVVRDRAHRALDTLLVYFAGHGLTDPHTEELYLALPDSDGEREYTWLRYEYLRRAVLDPRARARRTVLILDCCYSGRALVGKMSASAHVADQAVVDGTCVIVSCAETRPALSLPGETYTAFTGELITTLGEGVAGKPDPLDMDTLYRDVRRALTAKSRPVPQQRNRNLGGDIAIARNMAAARGAPSPPDLSSLDLRQREAEERLARLERRAEQMRLESEGLRREAEQRARETVETAQRLASAVAAAPEPDFQPFWFAVPVARPLMGEDGKLQPIAELASGVWHLAVGRRGTALVAMTQEGHRGLLLDVSELQWGVSEEPDGRKEPSPYGRSNTESLRRTQRAVREARRLVDAVTASDDPDFEPFWFAVPVARPLMSEDGALEQVAELRPGTWYLAVEQRGEGLVAQTQDGRRGFLLNTSNIQRG